MPTVKPTETTPADVKTMGMDSRTARKTMDMEAGEMLISEAVKRTAEEKKELKERQKESEEAPSEKVRDNPTLSRQSKWFGIEGKYLKDANIKWVLEMEAELWNALQNWFPSENATLSKQLQELSKLYLALLESILTHTVGEEQTAQMERLQAMLSEKLNLLMDANLNDLMEFLTQTKQENALQNVKASVYKQTAGETLTKQGTDTFFAKGNTASVERHRFFMPESAGGNAQFTGARSSLLSGGVKEGTLYTQLKSGNIGTNQAYDAQMKAEELAMSQRNTAISGKGETLFGGKSVLYTGKEMALANRFAGHISGDGNLFQNAGMTARNAEVEGALAAITSIKGQIFADSLERQSAIKLPVKNAIDQMIDHYLREKGALKVYYQMTDAYDRTKNPQKAIEDGLEYAYQMFLEKKQDVSYQNQTYYSEKAGFFNMLKPNQSLAEELAAGMKVLEENWRAFLRAIKKEHQRSLLLTLQRQSIWGMLMKLGEYGREEKQKRKKTILASVFAVLFLLIIYLCYYLFF